MLTFKQYLKNQELLEQVLHEINKTSFYVSWGFIKPDGGVIEKSGGEQEAEGSHERMAQKLGIGSKKEALRKGWIRWGLWDKQKILFFDYYLRGTSFEAKTAMIELAEKYKHIWNTILVDDEWSGRGKSFTEIREFRKEIFR